MVLVFVAASCNKEAESASLSFDRTSLYFEKWGADPQTISYTASRAKYVAVSSISDGWTATVNGATNTVMIWPSGATEEGMTNEDLPTEGSVVINALNSDNHATSYYIYLYIAKTQTLDSDGAELANCYVVTAPSMCYSFDAMHRPDGTDLATASVKLLWQSNPGVVKNVNLADGKALFYVTALEDDGTRLEDTNAVVAACNAANEVVWSWHLWIVNDNPLDATDTYSNNKVFMRYNLGAFTNSNGSTDEQKILDSYGMYYQWGRKDPFQRPYYFNASGADNESRYNEQGVYISEKYLERSSSNGTMEYVTANPMHFITNAACVEDGGDGVGDWLVSANDNLWNDAQKSLYDPCPYGWRVPTKEDLSVLSIADDNTPLDDTLRKQYGWSLSDGASTFFWSACGRRRYNDGKVENVNYYTKEEYDNYDPSWGCDPQPQPWAGYYWTSTTDASGKAVSLFFDLRTTRAVNHFDNDHKARKANGFQVRCVKE